MPELGTNVLVHSAFNSGLLLVTGSLPPFADVRSIPVAEGRFYNWDDEAQGRRVAFIGSDAKKQLFAGHGALGETITLGGIPYTIVGVMTAEGAGLELRRPRHLEGVHPLQLHAPGFPEQAASGAPHAWTGCW